MNKIITLNAQNIDKEHICCAIGEDKKNCERAQVKKNWMKTQFDVGHTFKKIDVRGKVFIEYTPAEKAWYPIIAPNYTFIQLLLAECENDNKNKNGIVALTTTKKQPFLVEKKFYVKHGFEVCDTAFPNFELIVKKFNKDAPNPVFTKKAKSGKIENTNGLVFYYSDLCPFISGHLENMIKIAQYREIPTNAIKIESLEQAKEASCPYGIMSVFLNGEFLTYELMLEKKFNLLLDKKLK